MGERIKAFLSKAEQTDLIAWMVGHQGNYVRYIEWCDKNEIPPENRFTKDYLKRWTDRKRALFRARAAQVGEDLRRQSSMDRGRRLKELETLAARLEEMAAKEKDPAMLVRLAEQIGKTLERIAKERGEWLKAPEDAEDETAAANRQLRDAFAAHFAKTEKRVIEARVVNP